MNTFSAGQSAARTLLSLRPRVRRILATLITYSMLIYALAPLSAFAQVSGNISPNSIEIDNAANLVFGNGVNVKNPGPNLVDWIKNSSANTDTPTYDKGVAVGLIPGRTAAVGGTGNWYGVRVVDDTLNGVDQDIFTRGGKVNDPNSWQIAPGSTGSSKFDATQAFLANNTTQLFFGMMRMGNNGTTAFEYEFNQKPPKVLSPGNPNQDYIPDRSLGDVLISFELQGSGGDSGSVVTYVFRHDGSNFVAFCDDDATTSGPGQGACVGPLLTSINADSTVQPPWGYVDSHGDWVLTPTLNRRLFAEAQVPLSLLPGVDSCGGSAFVQIRTRASAALGSDAKDTTKIFEYKFGGPTAGGLLSKVCGLNIAYDGSTSATSGSPGATLTYSWQFQKNSNADGSGTWSDVGAPVTGVSGTFTAPSAGRYQAILTITENGSCTDDVTTNAVNVFTNVGGSASLSSDCDDTFTYTAQGTGGSGSYAYEWTIYKEAGANDPVAKTFTGQSGTLDIDDFNAGANGPGSYYAIVRIKDAMFPTCYFDVTTNVVNIRRAVGGSASLVADCDDTFTYSAQGTGGSGNYTYEWNIYKEAGAVDPVAATFTGASGTLDIDDFNAGAKGPGKYYGIVRIKDTSNPECTYEVTTNAIDVRYLLTASAVKTSSSANANQADGSFSVLATGSTNADAADTIPVVKQWQQLTGGQWTNVGGDSATLTRTMSEIISLGSSAVEADLVSILSDPYSVTRSSLQLRFKATQTLNAIACPATSDPITVRAIKAIDP